MRVHPFGRASLGFTLVEMIVVIAVLGVLAFVAIPAYNSYTAKSKFTEVINMTSPTKAAIEFCAESGDCIVNNIIDLGNNQNYLLGSLTLSCSVQLGFYQYIAPLQQIAQSIADAATEANCTNIAPDGKSYANNIYTVGSVDPATGVIQIACDSPLGYECGFSVNVQPAPGNNGATGSSITYILPCVGMAPCVPPTKYASTVSSDEWGTITATAQTTSGLAAETYVLIPSYYGGRVDWTVSGTCKTRAGGALC